MADYLLLTKAKTPETGYEPAEDGGYDDEAAALAAGEDWCRDHPTRPALVERVGTNEVWSVVYEEGPASVIRDADGEEQRTTAPGVLVVVFDGRERPVLSIEDSDDSPGRQVIVEAAGLQGDHAAFAKYDEGHPSVGDDGSAGEVVSA